MRGWALLLPTEVGVFSIIICDCPEEIFNSRLQIPPAALRVSEQGVSTAADLAPGYRQPPLGPPHDAHFALESSFALFFSPSIARI